MANTVSLLSEFSAGRAEFAEDHQQLIHIGNATIDGDWREYLFLHPPAAISYSIPGDRMRLSLGIALHPDVWHQPGLGGCRFLVHLDDQLLFETSIEPRRFAEHRRWTDITIELPAGSGQQRRLQLSTRGLANNNYCWALWAQPLIVVGSDPVDSKPITDHMKISEFVDYPILLPSKTRFFFISGCMRSGTTWLMDLLNFHPDICCRGEMHVPEVIDLPFSLSSPTLESVGTNLQDLISWYFMPNNAWNLPFRDEYNRKSISKEMMKSFVRFFFEWTILNYVKAKGSAFPMLIGDKSPSHTRNIVKKMAYFFEPYKPIVIHMIRDPRDVAVSRWFFAQRQREAAFEGDPAGIEEDSTGGLPANCGEHDGYAGKLFRSREFLLHVFSEWRDVNLSLAQEGPVKFGDRYQLVRYEDLKSDFHGTMTSIFAKLGLEVSESFLSSLTRLTDYSKRKEKPVTFRKGVIGEWEKHFAPEDITQFEELVLPFSKRFGYA